MYHSHLSVRKSGRKKYYYFRSFIPKDLILKFNGRIELQISLKNVTTQKNYWFQFILKY